MKEKELLCRLERGEEEGEELYGEVINFPPK